MTLQDRIEQAKAIYKNACNKGFHDKEHSIEHYLVLVISELGEAINAHRKGLDVNKQYNVSKEQGMWTHKNWYLHKAAYWHFNGINYKLFEEHIKDTWQDEIADVYIRLMDLAMMIVDKNEINLSILKEREDIMKSEFDSYLQKEEDLPFTDTCFWITDLLITIFKECEDEEFLFLNLFYTAIYINNFFGDIDLDWHVAEKINYNRTRGYLNGKKY